jgi:hypothetical protein
MYWVWVLIPLVAILVGGFQEWLKFKEKQAKLGNSTRELGHTISSLRSSIQAVEQERDALVRRIQNLEAIVTSQAWDEAHGRPAEGFLGSALDDADSARDTPDRDADTIARMARRLDR